MRGEEWAWVIGILGATAGYLVHVFVTPWATGATLDIIRLAAGLTGAVVAGFAILVFIAGLLFAIYRKRYPINTVAERVRVNTFQDEIEECFHCERPDENGYVTEYFREFVVFGFVLKVLEWGANEDCAHHYHWPLDAELGINSEADETDSKRKNRTSPQPEWAWGRRR